MINWLEDPERYNPDKDDRPIQLLKMLKERVLS